MRKGFLYSDRVDSKADLSNRMKIANKYNSQKQRLKSMLQSSLNKKSYSTNSIKIMENELKMTHDSIEQNRKDLQKSEEFKSKLDALIVKSYSNSLDLINEFKIFYLDICKVSDDKYVNRNSNISNFTQIDLFSYTKFS